MPSFSRQAKNIRNSIQPGDYSNYSPLLNQRMSELYEQYGKTAYWSQFSSIPGLNLPGSVNVDSIDRDNFDYYRDLYNEYETSALSDINQLLGVIREEQYNSPSSQASRERGAGLNPDLLGNVSPGEASEFDDAASGLQIPSAVAAEQARVQNISSIAQVGMNFAEQFVGLAASFQGLKTGSLQNAGLELGLEGDVNDYAQNLLSSMMPTKNSDGDFVLPDGTNLGSDEDEVWHEFIKAAKKQDFSSYGSRVSKALRRAFNRYDENAVGVQAKFESLMKEFAGNRMNRSKVMSSPLWDDDAGRMLSKVVDGFGQIDYEVWKIQSSMTKEISEFQLSYYESANELGTPGKQAALEFQQSDNQLQYEQSADRLNIPERKASLESKDMDIKKLYQSIEEKRTAAIEAAEVEFNKIYQHLKGDKWYHVLGRILLPLARSLVSNGINRYMDAAAASLGHFQFKRPEPVINNNTKNIYDSTFNYQ